MNSNDTEASHLGRILRVQELMEQSPLTGLSLEKLAQEAHYSPFHFHRIFKKVTGDTPNQYLKRIKLSRAAYSLLFQKNLSLTEIAYLSGFNSSSDFSRVFRSDFGISPSEYRERLLSSFSGIISGGTQSISDIKICTLPRLSYLFIPCSGPDKKLQNPEALKAYQKLIPWGFARDLYNSETEMIGLTQGIPGIIPITKCRFKAGITISHPLEEKLSRGIFQGELNSQRKYLCLKFQWPNQNFSNEFWEKTIYILKEWMPKQGYIPDVSRPYVQKNSLIAFNRLHQPETKNEPAEIETLTLHFYMPIIAE